MTRVRVRKPCRIWEINKAPYRTLVTCACGWQQMVFHRNALARNSIANGAGNAHLKGIRK